MKNVCIELNGIDKYYGSNHIVKKLDLQVYQGEFLTLLGPSGCGKTTTLRMIAGFEEPTSGHIYLNGQEVTYLPPYKRDVNTVFQNYALFPHLNVRQNIEYGLKRKGTPKNEIANRVNEVLRVVQMESFQNRKPKEMSGGQQQRVAVARAIVNNPMVLLLDEPLGALDLKLRKQMQLELKHLQQELGMTFIYVTHDQEEALTMSDRVAVMNNGAIEQIDAPEVIYHYPQTQFVADFIGETNLVTGKVKYQDKGKVNVSLLEGTIVAASKNVHKQGEEVTLSIRPEHLALSFEQTDYALQGKLEEYIFAGNAFKAIVSVQDSSFIVYMDKRTIDVGETVYVTCKETPVVVAT